MLTGTIRATLAVLWLALAVAHVAAQEPRTPANRPVVAILDFTNSALVDHDLYDLDH